MRYWYGDADDVIFPWAEEAAGDADPEVLNMPELDFEKIASLEPDLILGLYSGMTAEDYGKLTAIAPTVAQTDDYVDYGTPWQQATTTIGAALGRSDLAEQLMADVEGRFQAVREDHPEWQGATALVHTWCTRQRQRAHEVAHKQQRRYASFRRSHDTLKDNSRSRQPRPTYYDI